MLRSISFSNGSRTARSKGILRDRPPVPAFADGWQLGKPDLVVTLSEPYTLGAGGTDVFRIFVVPLPVDKVRYVTRTRIPSRQRAAFCIAPTSASMGTADIAPTGTKRIPHLVTTVCSHVRRCILMAIFSAGRPDKSHRCCLKASRWRLAPDADLVLKMHMQPSGKPEVVSSSVGLYFGSDPPERTPMMLPLGRQNIDIPAGDKHYTIADSFVLPVDVQVQALEPHAHYRAREIIGTATLPDGTTKTLIRINDWDFRWQHVSRYVTPVCAPKGTTLAMRYTYDNSSDNANNPMQPPDRVSVGTASEDEMGDLWIQVLTRDGRDLDLLNKRFRPKTVAEDVVGSFRFSTEPESVALHDDLEVCTLSRPAVRRRCAVRSFCETQARARRDALQPWPGTHAGGKPGICDPSGRSGIRIRPDDALAHNNLGAILLQVGNADEALTHLREAVRLDPTNAEAQNNLGVACRERGEDAEAIDHFRRAVLASPDWVPPMIDLAWMLATTSDARLRNQDLSLRLAARAADLTEHRDPRVLDALAAAYASAGDFDRAVDTAGAALQLGPGDAFAAEIRARQALYDEHKPYRRPERKN